MKNAIFLDVTQCGSCNNRRFRGTYRLHHQGDKNRGARNIGSNFPCNMLWLLVTANIVPSLPIVVTLMMVVIHTSKC
jgi:hypothetical protein